jgi:hypothetical protein
LIDFLYPNGGRRNCVPSSEFIRNPVALPRCKNFGILFLMWYSRTFNPNSMQKMACFSSTTDSLGQHFSSFSNGLC